jgi:hypothetical protein
MEIIKGTIYQYFSIFLAETLNIQYDNPVSLLSNSKYFREKRDDLNKLII